MVAWERMAWHADVAPCLRSCKRRPHASPSETIVVKNEPGVIWFDETRFNFEQSKLKSVGGT